jgi:ribosomal protein S18 acetylase RimI-like enzyme
VSGGAELRAAGPADAEAALELLRRFYDEEHVPYDAGRLRGRLERFLKWDGGVLLLGREGAETVGLALVSTSMGAEFGMRGELEDLYVLPEWRGRGWAGRLLEGVRAWCRQKGVETLTLVVTPEGEAAHGLTEFYARRGFRRTGRAVLMDDLEGGSRT